MSDDNRDWKAGDRVWRFCPSTHCERRQECCSPHDCAARRIAARSLPRLSSRINVLWWLAAAVLGAAVWALAYCAAHAEPKGEIPPGVLPMQERWFHQPRIQACCSKADGYAVAQYDQVGDHYRVPHPAKPGEWLDVPPDAVIYNEGNPTGYAWLWLYPDNGTTIGGKVRCFIPNGGA